MTVEELKGIRESMHMSQNEFSGMLGVPRRTYQDWELGNHKAPQYVLDLIEFRLNNDPKIKNML